MTELIITLSAVFAVGLFVFLIPYLTYRMAFLRKEAYVDPYSRLSPENTTSKALVDRLMAESFEEIEITSGDGLKLRANLYYRKEGAPFQIQCHGYKSTPMLDFSGGALEALDNGCNLLLIHQRSHGRSEGRTISFGAKESEDLLLWIEELIKTYGEQTKIVLVGISMGAATVLSAAGKALPENVKCIVSDCPYSSTKEIIIRVARKMGFPAFLYPFVRLGAKLYGGFDPDADSPLKAVARATKPILFIHGEADDFVPCEMTLRLYSACPSEKELFTVPEASHGLSYIVDREGYRRVLYSFLDRHLG